ncbi:MAG: hypothetical protein M1834_000252 [Cirrosporium novae-zelandiae]|nr:MAG: hypothetical protein M1834_000252 [Cirrosporium novae-zelandiae]
MAEAARRSIFALAKETQRAIEAKLPPELRKPEVGVICGSGLGGLADLVHSELKVEINYSDLIHFPVSTVPGHAGKLVFAFLGQRRKPAVLMVGRTHFYEGHSIEKVTFPIRVFKLLGVSEVIVTNAAGSLNQEYAVGDIVVLRDHLNIPGFAGIHPLRGPNEEDFGVRFPALSDAYDLKLRKVAHQAWKKTSGNPGRGTRRIHEGVYAFVGGPSYETRAECRMLATLGADVVGMSTVPEICVARHCGIRVLALSLVTNKSVLDPGPSGDDPLVVKASDKELKEIISKGRANHEEVMEAGRQAAADLQVISTSPLTVAALTDTSCTKILVQQIVEEI